jgi:hypothetical protein
MNIPGNAHRVLEHPELTFSSPPVLISASLKRKQSRTETLLRILAR